jgi:hypothetical protein
MTSRRIVIRIEELNLHGFEPHLRPGVRDALERELAELFAMRPHAPYRGGRIERVVAPSIAVAPTASARTLGVGLANRIHGAAAAVGSTPKRRS